MANPARATEHDCEWVFPPGVYVCGGGNGGVRPPGDPDPTPGGPNKGWGDWSASGGECTITGGPNDGLTSVEGFRWLLWIEGPYDGSAVNAVHLPGYSIGDAVPSSPPQWDGSPATFAADGYVYDTGYCIDPGVAWDIYEEIEKRAPAPGFARDPRVRGLVGLEQWVWYTGGTEIAEFSLAWSDPVTGLDFELDARAHIEEYTWDFGDGTDPVVTSEPGSGPDDPGATHVYDAKGDVTITVEAAWVGEYRVYEAGAAPGAWQPVPNGPTFTATDDITVIEIRSCLGPNCP